MFALSFLIGLEAALLDSSSLPTASSHSPSSSSFTVLVANMLWLFLYGTILFLWRAGSLTLENWLDNSPARRLLSCASGALADGWLKTLALTVTGLWTGSVLKRDLYSESSWVRVKKLTCYYLLQLTAFHLQMQHSDWLNIYGTCIISSSLLNILFKMSAVFYC